MYGVEKARINRDGLGLGCTGPNCALDIGNTIGIFNLLNNQCIAKKYIAGCAGLSAGYVVKPSTTIDGAVDFCTPTSYDPIGIIVGPTGPIANGGSVWVGTDGQAQVYMSGITGIRGDFLTTLGGATGCVTPYTGVTGLESFAHIGHCNKNYASYTGICILHFN